MTTSYQRPTSVILDGHELNSLDADGVSWEFTSISAAWYAGAPMNVPQVQRVVSHGEFDQPGHRTGLPLTIIGWAKAADRSLIPPALERLASLLGEGQTGLLKITDRTQGLRWAPVKRLGLSDVSWSGGKEARYLLQLLAPDGYKYGLTSEASTGFAVEPEGVGFIWDAFPEDVATWQSLGTVYDWTGTPNASSSTKTVDGSLVDTNYCTTPSSETGPSFSGINGADTPVQSTDQVWVGTYSTKLNRGTGTNKLIGSRNIGASLPARTAGKVIKVSAYMYATSGSTGDHGFDLVGAGAVESADTIFQSVPGFDDWYRVQFQATDSGSGAVTARVRGGDTAHDIWVDAIKITYGDAGHDHGAYFDGDTPDVPAGTPGDVGIATVRNVGTADATPLFTVTGPAPEGGFTIVELATGRSLTYLGDLPEGSTLVINSADGSAWINGVADRAGDVVISGAWPSIPANTERDYLFQADNFSTAVLTVSCIATYL